MDKWSINWFKHTLVAVGEWIVVRGGERQEEGGKGVLSMVISI